MKKNLVTAKYDMARRPRPRTRRAGPASNAPRNRGHRAQGRMKALMAIDDAMKAALVKIHGVAEEDELPDSIQDIEFDRDGSLSEEYDTVEKLQKVFATAMPKADKAALLKVAESTIKQLGEL